MVQWQELKDKKITKISLREKYIATQSIVIQALGRLENYFYMNPEVDMKKYIKRLDNINWNRNAKVWYLRAISETGRIITNKKAAVLIANVMKKEMEIPLSKEEQNAENALQKIINN